MAEAQDEITEVSAQEEKAAMAEAQDEITEVSAEEEKAREGQPMPEAATDQKAPAGTVAIKVKVAEGAKPGQSAFFVAPNGQQVQTTIPEGKEPGDEFEVFMPLPVQRKVKVTVPEGVVANQKIVFQGPFGYDMQAVVPEGKEPGDAFYVYAQPPPPQTQPSSAYTLTVPEDSKEGDEVFFQAANGQQMKTIVPEGKAAGDTFQVSVAHSLPQRQDVSSYTLTVPDDKKAGDEVYFQAPDGQQIRTIVPEGKVAGDSFQVNAMPPCHQNQPATSYTVTVPEDKKAGDEVHFQTTDGRQMKTIVPDGKTAGDNFEVNTLPTCPSAQSKVPVTSYTVTVPNDKKAGDEIFFQAAEGQQMRTVVPEGKTAGDTFQVDVGQSGPSQITVTVPEGKAPGDELEFIGPGGVTMKTQIPKGKKPGDQFSASLSEEQHPTGALAELCTAAANGDLEGAQNLIKEPEVDVNGTHLNGFTPLFYAASSGQLEVAKWLLEVKAEVNVSSDGKRAPLHWAARNGHSKVVELLLGAKAAVGEHDSTGRSPLALALGYNRPEVAEMLRAAGAKEPKTADESES